MALDDVPTAPSGVATRLRAPRAKRGRMTIHDVAALAGVASVTASRFFNEPHKVSPALRARLEAVIRQTGFMPSRVARQLAAGQGGVVGAVMQNAASPTFARMVDGMTETLEARGFQLFIATSRHSQQLEERAIKTFAAWHPSALILTRGDHAEAVDAYLRTLSMPVVEAWEIVPGRPYHQVGFRQQDVGAMLAGHFIEQGARSIRFALNGSTTDLRAQRRAEGYAEAMRRAGLAPDIARASSEDDFEAGEEHLARIADLPRRSRPEAVVFAHDALAVAAVLKAPAFGIAIPRDLAVAGFGDMPVGAIIQPALTTVRTAPYAIGAEAANIVLALMATPAAGQAIPQLRHVPCELVERASSRRIGRRSVARRLGPD